MLLFFFYCISPNVYDIKLYALFFQEIKRKLTKGRKPKAHDPSNHSLQRLKRKRQAVKTVVGELILNSSDSSILLPHISFLMKLGWKLFIITSCTGMNWAGCSIYIFGCSQVVW